MCPVTLDDELYRQTDSGLERSALVHFVVRATLRGCRPRLVAGRVGARGCTLVYYTLASWIAGARQASGVILIEAGPYDAREIGEAAALLYDTEPFAAARLDVARDHGRWRVKLVSARRPGRPALLAIRLGYIVSGLLPLADSYEGFLARLGKHTRRNLRKFRATVERSGVRFEVFDHAPPESFSDTLFQLCRRNGPVPVALGAVELWERRIPSDHEQFYSVLRTAAGRAFSLCRGFLWGRTLVMTYQLNDREFYEQNPSMLHRAFLAPWAIERGIREIVFVDGCAGPLSNACLAEAGASIMVIPLTLAGLLQALTLPVLRLGTLWQLAKAALPTGPRRRPDPPFG